MKSYKKDLNRQSMGHKRSASARQEGPAGSATLQTENMKNLMKNLKNPKRLRSTFTSYKEPRGGFFFQMRCVLDCPNVVSYV